MMNDYCNGTAYATGCFAYDAGKKYLIVRNVDSWYPEIVAAAAGCTAYESKYNFSRDGKNQWTAKARNIHSIPGITEIKNVSDFCRAYIEIHGILDAHLVKNKKGDQIKRLRLRVYGNLEIINFLNNVLPAGEKKVQYIKNRIGDKYCGQTHALYYQSRNEIAEILKWIDGSPKNIPVWDRWKNIMS